MMIKLISTTAAVMFAAVSLADAAPRQGTASKAGKTAQVRAVKTTAKPANRKVARAKYRRPAAAQKTAVKVQRPVVKPETTVAPVAVKTTFAPAAAKTTVAPVAIRSVRHDLKAEEVELKRLKSDVKASQKAGDWRRVARDRRAMYQLEADVKADKEDLKDQQRQARNAKKKSRIPFWGWWRRS